MPDRTAFHDLPASAFPFTIELLDAETREVCWSLTAAAARCSSATWPGRPASRR